MKQRSKANKDFPAQRRSSIATTLPAERQAPFHSASFVLLIASVMAVMCGGASTAQAQTPPDINAVAAQCRALFNSTRTVSDMGRSRADVITIRRCIDYGIDPPLRMRDNNGRGTSKGSSGASRIASRNCGPFTTCNYSTAVSNSAEGLINPIGDNASFQNNLVPASRWTAPQFTATEPPQPNSMMPEQLATGGTIYFYDYQCPTTPANALVVPNTELNYYSSGEPSCLNEGHIMTPSLPADGNVMGQAPVTMDRNGVVNWDDWGVIILPPGIDVTINGMRLQSGVPIFVQHSGDMYLPAGTQLYTLPGGTNTNGSAEHSPPIEYAPYEGPLVLPDPRGEIGPGLMNVVPPPTGDADWWLP